MIVKNIPQPSSNSTIPMGSMVVPFCGSYLASYKVIPKRRKNGAYGKGPYSIA